MVTTRAGAAKASRKGTSPRHLDQDSPLPSVEPISPVSPTPSLVISTNNLSYNVSTFDAHQRRRIKRGLQDSGMRMKYCTSNIDEEDPNIQTQYFYINDDVEVVIGDKHQRPRCSCGANENGVACKVGLLGLRFPKGMFDNRIAYLLGRRSCCFHRARGHQGSTPSTFNRWFYHPAYQARRCAPQERPRDCSRRPGLGLRGRRRA